MHRQQLEHALETHQQELAVLKTELRNANAQHESQRAALNDTIEAHRKEILGQKDDIVQRNRKIIEQFKELSTFRNKGKFHASERN